MTTVGWIFAVSFFVGSMALAAGPSGPSVLTIQGKVQVSTGLEAAMATAKVGQVLREKATLETGEGSLLKIRLDANRVLVLFENTRVSFPGIRWEGGGVPLVILEHGRLRWTATSGDGVGLRTALYELEPPAGDFIFRMDPKSAKGELQVINGEVLFKALNAEDSSLVKTGHKISFQGVLEDGEIAYDILLKGRRIPRGQLGVAVPLSKEELTPFLEEERRAKDQLAKIAAEKARKKKAEVQAGLICAEPKGRLNECAWVCEGNRKGAKECELSKPSVSCVRQRCNANGQWADRYQIPQGENSTRCKAVASVGACDY